MLHPIGDSNSVEYCVHYSTTKLSDPGCVSPNDPLRLWYVFGFGLYQYIAGNETPFYRKVTLTRESNDEVKVKVEVSWEIKGQSHNLIVEDRLWNWK